MRSGNFVQALESRRLLSANLVADFGGFYPTDSVDVGNISFFTANDGVHGTELWRSDGTMEGTRLVRDITSGHEGSNIGSMLAIKKGVMFITQTTQRTTVWYSDGTSKRTVVLATFSGEGVQNPADRLVNGRYLFAIGESELWASDGTVAGTGKIANVDSYIGGRSIGYVGNRMLWSNDYGTFWSTDGTAGGTFKFPPKQGGLPSDMPGWWWVDALTPFDGKLIIVSGLTTEVWITDGTVAGTARLGDVGMHYMPLAEQDGRMYMWAMNSQNDLKAELLVTDGTPESLKRVVALNQELRNLVAQPFGDEIYIFAQEITDNHSLRLWATDGTADGTHQIASNPKQFIGSPILIDGKILYFVRADDGDDSTMDVTELWSIDPTLDQVSMVKSIGEEYVGSVTVVQDKLFFSASAGVSSQLWKSDGTESGTAVVKDIPPNNWFSLNGISGNLVLSWSGASSPHKHYAEILDPNTNAAPLTVAQNMARLADGTLRIYGSEQDDAIRVYRGSDPSRLYVQINGLKRSFDASAINKIVIYGYSGDDKIEIFEKRGIIAVRSRIFGGEGDDTICTGSGQDTVYAENGDDVVKSGNSADVISGDDGNDTINAGAGNDTANGDEGTDSIIGGAGADMLGGGDDESDDFLDGGSGQDVVFGSAVYDIFYKPAGDPGELVDCILQS